MKTVEETIKGYEHDGSFIPIEEVKRLMKAYAIEAVAEHDKEMYLNMQYYMEFCRTDGYVTPKEWIEKHKHF